MKKRVLLSIHPEHAEAILQGLKQFEFRKVIFKEEIDEIVLYATSPIQRVVGSFRVEEIYEDEPNKLWRKTRTTAGVTKQLFENYFKDRSRGFAIKVAKPVRFARPLPLSRFLRSNVAPQSFCYI